MIHSYDSAVAQEVGVNAAVLFNGIVLWCRHNEANGTNVHEGKAWTYNSVEAFTSLYPEFSTKEVRNALNKLRERGFVEVGNFNKSAYDRTTWYCIGTHGRDFSSCLNEQIHLPEKANENVPEGEPIPSNNQVTTSTTPPIAPHDEVPVKEIIDHLNDRCHTSFRATSEATRRLVRARWAEGFRLDDFKRVIDNKAGEWERDPKMRAYLRPQTLFGTKFEAYLNQTSGGGCSRDFSAYD